MACLSAQDLAQAGYRHTFERSDLFRIVTLLVLLHGMDSRICLLGFLLVLDYIS